MRTFKNGVVKNASVSPRFAHVWAVCVAWIT